MSSTPREPTERKPRPRDWRIRYLPESNNTSSEALSVLKCPFNTISEPKDSVPTEYTEKVRHLQEGQNGAPYTGYYAQLNNALVSVSNVYGVWFEVRLRKNNISKTRPPLETTWTFLMLLDPLQVCLKSISRGKFCDLKCTCTRDFSLDQVVQAMSLFLFCTFFTFLPFFTLDPFFRIDHKKKRKSKWQSSCFKHSSS